ncbi:hypothetical protein [Kitasatospora sp. NPDC088346]|uniref:hypothetical protein n=1 Tax=Kitasatospora sp. NPDC088346 TaxID=3364073 RepID=UPI003830DC53
MHNPTSTVPTSTLLDMRTGLPLDVIVMPRSTAYPSGIGRLLATLPTQRHRR